MVDNVLAVILKSFDLSTVRQSVDFNLQPSTKNKIDDRHFLVLHCIIQFPQRGDYSYLNLVVVSIRLLL